MDDIAVRIGDAERRDVDARLQRAVGDGQLTLGEYEERSAEVWQARTRGQLEAVTRDLPSLAPAPAPGPPRTARPRRAIAVMSGDELRGPVAPGQPVEAYAVMGGAVVDLRGELPAEVQVRAVAVMGGIEVLVPRGVTVHLSGLAFMGGRDVTVEAARPGAPVVHVQAYALMGGVEVKHGKDAPEASLAPAAVPLMAPPAHGSVALHRSGAARRQRRTRRFGLATVLAALLVGGGVVASQSDATAIFGSTEHTVTANESDVHVGVMFGSAKVIVPDDAQVSVGGLVVFGSRESRVPGGGSGRIITVDGAGAFGSVEILTQSQAAADDR